MQKESRLGQRLRRLGTVALMPSDGHTCYSCSICKIKRRRKRERARGGEACAAISYNACSGWEDTRDTLPFLVF